ncbi:MAG: hypothetical protein QM680_01485 [Luteolibacter sp.]
MISTDDGRYFYEPEEVELVSFMEEMLPEPDVPCYFMLLFQKRCYFQVWMHPEGVIVEIRFWQNLIERKFTHWIAATAPSPVPCRKVGSVSVAEEHFIPFEAMMNMGLSFFENPDVLPERDGIFWLKKEEHR